MGIGLVPKVLVEDELSRNELVSIGDAITSERSYYLVYPPENDTLPSLVAFRDWLLKSC
jgi:DNA-binding transcriptional LysR family regulator